MGAWHRNRSAAGRRSQHRRGLGRRLPREPAAHLLSWESWGHVIATKVLNSKTGLFFPSFVPRFVVLDKGHVALQLLLLGSTSGALNTAVDLLVVVFAAAVAKRITKSKSYNVKQRGASGIGMIGLGVYVVVGYSR